MALFLFKPVKSPFSVDDSFDFFNGQINVVRNALPFGSARDPRVPVLGSTTNSQKGIDAYTPWVGSAVWSDRSAPVTLVNGVDARLIEAEAAELGLDAVVRQSDSEAQLLDWIHAAADAGDPVIINAGALTHTSIALRDACAELRAPLIEVHISNVHAREEFRHHSYLSAVATGVIVGLGVQGYLLALRYLAKTTEPDTAE